MKPSLAVLSFALVLLLPQAVPVAADEGMWLPNAIGRQIPIARLKAMGMTIAPELIWSDSKPSLKDAMLMVGNAGQRPGTGIEGFGSASFVSSHGLILTNHHVAYDAIAALSKPEENLVRDGFVAKAMADERSCPAYRMQMTTGIEDVTAAALVGVTAEMTPGDREATIEKNLNEIAAKAREKVSDCVVKEMDNGGQYFLFTYDVLEDIRLVYAPPASIGEYGGDIDNWIWPRHTGDFSYLRAYVAPDGTRRGYHEDNVPYEPKMHLKTTLAGVKPDDFCFIMGHPGRTMRFRTSYSVDYNEKISYPRQIEMFRGMLAERAEQAKESEARALEMAADTKSIANTLKYMEGMVEGLAKLDVVARKRRLEEILAIWIDANTERKARWGDIFPQIQALYAELAAGPPNGFMEAFVPKIKGLRRAYQEALAEFSGSGLYPDANMTLRFTYGSVQGYEPRDGIWCRPVTTAPGILEKHTGVEPFNAPAKLRALVGEKDWGGYGDAEHGLVTCFLSTNDITGGNSGSPIMNGKGELIGLAFDGNYESMSSDFRFEEKLTRTINVDIRYVLWCTEKLAGLDRLIEEMDIVH